MLFPARGELINLFPAFYRFVNYPELVKPQFLSQHPEIYGQLAVSDEQIRKSLGMESEVNSLLARFSASHQATEQRVALLFPGFDLTRVRVCLAPSFGSFDARIRHDQPSTILFGLDAIGRFYGDHANLAVLYSHELAHVYHFSVNPLPANIDQIPLYRLIWQEGFATYVSKRLNPAATLSEILLDPRLATRGEQVVRAAASKLLIDMDSTDDAMVATYLAHRKDETSRLGYLVGYRIVERMADQQKLVSLARLRGIALRNAFKGELRKVALDR